MKFRVGDVLYYTNQRVYETNSYIRIVIGVGVGVYNLKSPEGRKLTLSREYVEDCYRKLTKLELALK